VLRGLMVRSTGVGEVCVCQDVSGDRRVEVAVQILMKVYWAWQDLGPLMGKIRKFSLVSLNLGEISIRSLYSYTQRWGGGFQYTCQLIGTQISWRCVET